MRSTNNETRVERNRSTCRQHYGVIVKFGEPIARGFGVPAASVSNTHWLTNAATKLQDWID